MEILGSRVIEDAYEETKILLKKEECDKIFLDSKEEKK